ncbi:MAG: type II toxin-antitoxin system RelE/ParE family toxin [Treponema sp.]|nr:type II toxin-antitoxin system RelE/ParE family toxin [Treponema sp.]
MNITDIAEGDILSTVEYIAEVLQNTIAANNLLDEIEKCEIKLEYTPHIYPFVSDEYLAKKGIKFIMIKNYIIFFVINEDDNIVNVIRFLHGRRDWKNILRENV